MTRGKPGAAPDPKRAGAASAGDRRREGQARGRQRAPQPPQNPSFKRTRSQGALVKSRTLILGLALVCAFIMVMARMVTLALESGGSINVAVVEAPGAFSRAMIVDRNGKPLAMNLKIDALYAQPEIIIDQGRVARELAKIFPGMSEGRLLERLQGGERFIWLSRKITPAQKQAAHDIGDPGLGFAPRKTRIYPDGPLFSHVLGGARFGAESATSAEIKGVAGIEKHQDTLLRSPATPDFKLRLSLDYAAQLATRDILMEGMRATGSAGASAVLMDARTGEILSLVSLPDFDPNIRPRAPGGGDPAQSPLFNRAVQGLYEVGSTFKVFTAAAALRGGAAKPDTEIDMSGRLVVGGFEIKDKSEHGPGMTLTDVLVKSSNKGIAALALAIGTETHQEMLERLGLLEPTRIELTEAGGARPLKPGKWGALSTATISYGYGISVSPLHLAAAYAAIANGGRRVHPTLLMGGARPQGERVMPEEVARSLAGMMRKVVTEGTARRANIASYPMAGKTGTANKQSPRGGYHEDKVIATFAGFFPAGDPKYVIVTSFDEPKNSLNGHDDRTASATAAPAAAKIALRVGPLLGLIPEDCC